MLTLCQVLGTCIVSLVVLPFVIKFGSALLSEIKWPKMPDFRFPELDLDVSFAVAASICMAVIVGSITIRGVAPDNKIVKDCNEKKDKQVALKIFEIDL